MLRADALHINPLPPLSFSVARGEALAIEGPSGAGKTRLLRALADLDPAPGYVFLNGAERHEMPGHHWRQLVRYTSAEPAWWSETARGALTPETTGRALRIVTSLGLDPSLLDKPLATLSTGERRRLALARALTDDPQALLLDEPTSGLDAHAASLVEDLIARQLQDGRIVVFTSHDPEFIARLAHIRLQLAPSAPPRQRVSAP